jgi:hypothetical protein
MQALRIYSRQGCHLCELLIEELLPMIRGRLATEVCDIDSRPDWRERFDVRIPVVEFEGEVISEYPLDRQAVAKLLERLP